MTALSLFSKKNNEKNPTDTPSESFVAEKQPQSHAEQNTAASELQKDVQQEVRSETERYASPGEQEQQTNTIASLQHTLKSSRKKPTVPVTIVRDEMTKQVEKIMEQGLVDAFKKMTRVQQQEFKMKGEETAQQIRDLLRKTKVKMRKIFRLLFLWLKLLPGVNKYFIEQEAKIKADQILQLKRMYDHEQK